MSRRYAVTMALLLVSTLAAGAEEIVELPVRAGVVQPYLLSFDPDRKHETVAVLFAGGDGYIGLREYGVRIGTNFLVRSRGLFLKNGIATAIVDSPSDQRGMTDGFRSSKEHVDDIAAIVDDVRKRLPRVKVFLVGTSRGTVSAGYAGAALSDRIDGVVLTASLFNASRGGAGLSDFDFGTVRVPMLLVHHRLDGCTFTPYSAAARLAERFPLVSVNGGDPPRSGPCDALSYHGFLGREQVVVEAISAWMRGKTFATEIR